MKTYAILTECLSCGDKKIWRLNSEADSLAGVAHEAVGYIDNIVLQEDYKLCCPSSPIMILTAKLEEYQF